MLEEDQGIPHAAITHEDFTRLALPSFHEKCRLEPAASGTRHLKMLKEAMKETGKHLSSQFGQHRGAVELDDRLGVTMRFLRAAEHGAMGSISTCLLRYPYLKDLVDNPYEVDGNLTRRLQPVREHAVGLAREHALDELGKVKQAEQAGEQERASRARRRASCLLYRLSPGRCGAVRAIKDRSGTHLTEPAAMAAALRTHWQQVFRARGIDEDLLQQWLKEDADHRAEQGPLRDGLLHQRLENEHVAKALK